jgi:hypothetical protein
MPRLSATQREILQRAIPNAGLIIPLPRNAKERRAARALLKRGFLIETKSQRGALEWRVDRQGEVWALGLSAAGMRAIGWAPTPLNRSRALAERLIKVFVDGWNADPTFEEFQAFVELEVRPVWPRVKR